MGEVGETHELWSDNELKAALDAYLFMLQLELSSIPFSVTEHSEALLSGPLHKRNDASVRYRMRNISHVVGERGLPTLSAFSSAPQVGRNVKRRLNELLDDRPNTINSILQLSTPKTDHVGLPDVLQSLSELKNRIAALEDVHVVGIGHNNPPDSIDLSVDEVSGVVVAIDSIEHEIVDGQPDSEVVRAYSKKVSAFGLKVAVWCGQRFTEFAKAGAVAAGTGFGISLTGLGGQIIDTLKSLFQLVF